MRLPSLPALSLATLFLQVIRATEAPAPFRVAPRHVNKVPHSFEGRWVHGRYRMLPPIHKRGSGATKADLQPRAPAPSKTPTVNSMFGVIRVADSTGGVAFISPALNGAGQFTTTNRGNALPIQLPSTSPSGIFSIFSSVTGGYIDSSKPLSDFGSTRFRLAKRQAPAAIAAAAAIQAAADAAYFAIVAAQDSAAILIFQAAEAATGPIPTDPSRAAAMTAANANYAQAYTRCVAYNAAKTKAANVLAASADASLAPRFAAEEIFVAARAAPLGGDPLCESLTAGYKTSQTAASLIAFLTPAPIVVKPVVASVPMVYASAVVPTGAGNSATSDGSIWTMSASSDPGAAQPLAAVYENSNGEIVSPITFFVVGSISNNFVGLTGDLPAYNLFNPTAPGTEVFLSFMSS